MDHFGQFSPSTSSLSQPTPATASAPTSQHEPHPSRQPVPAIFPTAGHRSTTSGQSGPTAAPGSRSPARHGSSSGPAGPADTTSERHALSRKAPDYVPHHLVYHLARPQ